MYLDRLLDRVKQEHGVSFKEFRDFCQFLNNLEDFSIAMRMYTLADHPISKGRRLLSSQLHLFACALFSEFLYNLQTNSHVLLKSVPI